ncbi:MAG: HD-GYP domain-containing protein [Pyrinomonadaceae bacterium]
MKNALAQKKGLDEKLLQTAAAIDDFEGCARPHALHIAVVAEAIAKKFYLSPHDCLILRQAALVHDLGEMVMNRNYIKVSRELTVEERADMRRHPVIGEQEAAKRGLNRAVGLLVRWHHEWWNGMGYPDALEREQIPLVARILRVADSYVSLTGARPYRAAFSEVDAKKFLTEWAGIEFDPQVVQALLSLEELNFFREAKNEELLTGKI